MQIAAVGRALPDNFYDQQELLAAFEGLWGERFHNPERLAQIHRNVCVGGRHLALPIARYAELGSFSAGNDAFIACAVDLGARAAADALQRAGLLPGDVDHIFFASTTGIATPSIDARLVNRLELRRDVKRTPTFGLGCLAGAAGIARLTDYLVGHPREIGLLVSVELCSLTLQREDLSLANIISSGLFGDGAAAVVLRGASRPRPAGAAPDGPRVVATRSVFYPHTERVMGWDITSGGFQVVLSAEVPEVVQRHLRGDVEAFVADHGLRLGDLQSFVLHPGGPKVLQAFEQTLELASGATELSWRSLEQVGNLSSASVLLILGDTIADRRPAAGSFGLLASMGPGFCSELVLLQW